MLAEVPLTKYDFTVDENHQRMHLLLSNSTLLGVEKRVAGVKPYLTVIDCILAI